MGKGDSDKLSTKINDYILPGEMQFDGLYFLGITLTTDLKWVGFEQVHCIKTTGNGLKTSSGGWQKSFKMGNWIINHGLTYFILVRI